MICVYPVAALIFIEGHHSLRVSIAAGPRGEEACQPKIIRKRMLANITGGVVWARSHREAGGRTRAGVASVNIVIDDNEDRAAGRGKRAAKAAR